MSSSKKIKKTQPCGWVWLYFKNKFYRLTGLAADEAATAGTAEFTGLADADETAEAEAEADAVGAAETDVLGAAEAETVELVEATTNAEELVVGVGATVTDFPGSQAMMATLAHNTNVLTNFIINISLKNN